MEANFRSTVVSSKPRFGRRAMVSGPVSSLSVVGSDAGGSVVVPRRGARAHVQFAPGATAGASHIFLGDGSEPVAHAARHFTQAPTAVGGDDHIDFSFGSTAPSVESCGLKESEMRAALAPSAVAAAEALPGAGLRVPVRPRRMEVTAGSADNVSEMWGGRHQPLAYGESVAGAQARLAMDPVVREDAAGLPLAGARVRARWLGESIRTSRPVGGVSTLPIKWGMPTQQGSGAGQVAASDPPTSPRSVMRTNTLVGGFSGKYLAPAPPAAQPADAPGGGESARSGQNSSGAAGVLAWAPPADDKPVHHHPLHSHHDPEYAVPVTEDMPAAGGRPAVATSLPLKPLPHAKSVRALLVDESSPVADSRATRTMRRMAPATSAPPPFATADDAHAAPPIASFSGGKGRQPRVIIDAAPRERAPAQARHLTSSFTFG